jgi:hypothetical protein
MRPPGQRGGRRRHDGGTSAAVAANSADECGAVLAFPALALEVGVAAKVGYPVAELPTQLLRQLEGHLGARIAGGDVAAEDLDRPWRLDELHAAASVFLGSAVKPQDHQSS